MIKVFNKDNLGIRAILLLVGMFLVGVGIVIFLECALGSDPITVLLDGMNSVLGISYGACSSLYNSIFLIIAIVVARKNVGFGTIFYSLTIGIFLEVAERLLIGFSVENLPILKVLLWMLVGQVILSIGMSLVVCARVGYNSLDAIIFKISDKTHRSYGFIRTIFDAVFVIVGFCMGGIIGIGTIISVISTGYMMNKIIELVNRRIYRSENCLVQ